MRESYRDFPGFYDRLITARNQKWLPKIDTYLASKQKYFVVVGVSGAYLCQQCRRLVQAVFGLFGMTKIHSSENSLRLSGPPVSGGNFRFWAQLGQ